MAVVGGGPASSHHAVLHYYPPLQPSELLINCVTGFSGWQANFTSTMHHQDGSPPPPTFPALPLLPPNLWFVSLPVCLSLVTLQSLLFCVVSDVFTPLTRRFGALLHLERTVKVILTIRRRTIAITTKSAIAGFDVQR
ncbi:hypothetical protein NA57DRAFT_54161 [Rhizodiscina lignyota]|uniref:Uncharacterized protein n=1 Tax=Rhizodiscina lignyota TaxID=1504668 RepID=A0A9P4IN23_9PEZI|nr:hypothetical protein NA57DRAFT_54161 [Rhizodiscina lignyota]